MESGQPLCGTGIRRRFISASERTRLPRLPLHDLRDTFGTQAILVFKVREVQRPMGHRHITTIERYLHDPPDLAAPIFVPARGSLFGRLWGDLALFGSPGRQPLVPESAVLQALCIEATTGIEPV
jgi:hypothetical protein